MASHEFGPRKQQLIYWLIQAVALLLFAGIVALTNAVVPLIANVQSVASAQ
jgi:thiosulfate reductase cytochrome b subunit